MLIIVNELGYEVRLEVALEAVHGGTIVCIAHRLNIYVNLGNYSFPRGVTQNF